MSQLFTSGGQSISFSISPSNEYSGLISFRIDCFDLRAVQGTLKSLLQHRSSKASLFWHSAFFIVQLSHPYMTTGKTITLTRWTFVGKVMSLLFNTCLGLSSITRWSTPKSDWFYSLQPKMKKLYTVSKNKTGSRLWLRSWTPYCQIQT